MLHRLIIVCEIEVGIDVGEADVLCIEEFVYFSLVFAGVIWHISIAL